MVSLTKYDRQYPFAPWILKIASNYCIDQIRRRKARKYKLWSDLSEAEERKALWNMSSQPNKQDSIQEDREKYLSYRESAHERYGAVIHVYCLMGNHYHLLLETPRGNLSKILQYINGSYTTYFNIKHRAFGPSFSGEI
jgi:hypothetical protein